MESCKALIQHDAIVSNQQHRDLSVDISSQRLNTSENGTTLFVDVFKIPSFQHPFLILQIAQQKPVTPFTGLKVNVSCFSPAPLFFLVESNNCELPLLTPCSKAVMSQALKDTFSGFTKEQCRLGIPNSKCFLFISSFFLMLRRRLNSGSFKRERMMSVGNTRMDPM